jgi:hypothetical protein
MPWEHTELGCQTVKRPCCKVGTRKVVLVCGCARVCKRRRSAKRFPFHERDYIDDAGTMRVNKNGIIVHERLLTSLDVLTS